MGNPVQLWQARDGSIWRTEEDMQAHESDLDRFGRVDAWLDSREPWARGARTRARNIVVTFLEDTGGAPIADPVVVSEGP